MDLWKSKVGLVIQFVLLLELVSALKSARNFIIVPYSYDKFITLKINASIEYIFEYSGPQNAMASDHPVRITVSSQKSSRKYPIFVTARQQKGILSWQLPIVVQGKEIPELSRTLCPNKNFFINDDSLDEVLNRPAVTIYTSSLKNISFSLSISLVEDFYLKPDLDKVINISPSSPQVYFYSFKEDVLINDANSYGVTNGKKIAMQGNIKNENSQTPKNIIIRLDSDDDYCMLVSIQNSSCPFFDTENDIMFEGFYETVSRRGGLTIPSEKYPLGFYIVLVVKSTDEDCTGFEPNSTDSQFINFFKFNSQPFDHRSIAPRNDFNENRLKSVKINIKSSISSKEYWIASTSAVLFYIAIYIIFLFGLFCHKYKPMNFEDNEPETVLPSPNSNMISSTDEIDDNSQIQPSINDETSDDSTHAVNEVVNRSNSHVSIKSPELCDKLYLNKLCTNNLKDIKRQSGLYLWHLITIAIFYALPVIQLVITYQRVLNNSGNQDLCYYNFLCAHPISYLSDFNHVFSNIGYVLLGGLFIFFTWKKHKKYAIVQQANFGVPPHHGLFYAMGVALMMEGVLSASYHVCPNHSNFQFDTSFMYIMAVLCMVKIYQTRHPDVNAKAHSTFNMLAAAILICLFGVLFPNFYFWLFFTILHISTCFLLTFQIYYMGQWKFSFCCCTSYKCGDVCKPIHRSWFILVVIANLCNFGLAIWGLYNHSKDFATHLLFIFLMNLTLHLVFYITMKLVNKERLLIYTWMLLVSATITWGEALYFFFSPSTLWELTPAESRTYNAPCVLLKFYDYHDIWHFLSAAALFFSFMLLLTLDDDITNKPHSRIPVF